MDLRISRIFSSFDKMVIFFGGPLFYFILFLRWCVLGGGIAYGVFWIFFLVRTRIRVYEYMKLLYSAGI